MKAILLAGGKGTKMFPFTTHRQKCCLPIGNVANIRRIVEQLEQEEVSEIVVVLQEQAQDVVAELVGTKVRYVFSMSLIDTLAQETQEDCLIYYGDIVTDQKTVHEVLLMDGNAALVQPVSEELHSQDYLCANVVDGELVTIYGHPRGTYANHRLAGLYVLRKEVLQLIAITRMGFDSINCGQMPDHDYHLENTMQMALEQGINIHAVVSHDVIDLDFPWNILDANQWYCQKYVATRTEDEIDPSAKISESAIIRGKIKLGKNSVIGDHVIIKGNCEIGDDVKVEDGAILYPNCVIGNGSVVTDHCKINAETVIGPKNKIGFAAEFAGVTFKGVAQVHASEMYGVIGNYVDVAAGCVCGILKFDDQKVSQKVKGKRYITKNTNMVAIGDYTRTGICNTFYPGVKVGSHCAMGPGLVIQHDIMDNQLVMPKQEVDVKPWGTDKYGW